MNAQRKKDALRVWVRTRRQELDETWVKAQSILVCRRIFELPEFDAARAVGCYLPMPGEADTGEVIVQCRAVGKRLCVPAFCEETGQYELAWLKPGEKIVTGRRRAPEPADRDWIAEEDRVDVILAPGLAFDAAGTRLGHGGGHYDNLLRGRQIGIRVGVAFEFQVAPRVPATEKDVGMDVIVTNERIIRRIPGRTRRFPRAE
ncbi:MAG: 5-formyltetrahydrofolate cyclo-ligase [Verrucomicrobiota bacterium]|nr:5-formyltetrahydrofolate cyclo-ligase [Verrucomicrobiota bacterium]